MTNNMPYLRNKIPTLLVLSAAAIALLLASPMLFFNVLVLQPAQATQNVVYISVKTDSPVKLGTLCSSAADAALTFDAQSGNGGESFSGTFKITNSSNSSQVWWSGNLSTAIISPPSEPGTEYVVDITYNVDGQGSVCGRGGPLKIATFCPGGANTEISLYTGDRVPLGSIHGTVDCGTAGDTTTAAQPSSSPMTGTTTTPTQDSDGDGIPDSSDRCTHNSNPRCFKEGEDTSTTTTQLEQPSSDRTGNQTR